MKILESNEIKKFFNDNGYDCIKPHEVVNNKDTVFISAGIQPLLQNYRDGNLNSKRKLFIPQPVIRTQYSNSISEGTSIAFVNVTTSNFNNSEEEHNKMVKEWYELLYEIGMKKNKFTTITDIYNDNWDDLEVQGKRTFHYYDGLEIGDTTFFTKVKSSKDKNEIESMSDLGFGLERLRWKTTNGSYYDLYTDSKKIDVEVKAYLLVIALLAVNNIKPSNKNCGYRARLFSKKLVNLLHGRNLNLDEEQYLDECIEYWKNWQQNLDFDNKKIITDEFVRNGNRYIINKLNEEGYTNLNGININISREELLKRLNTSGVNSEKIKKLVR